MNININTVRPTYSKVGVALAKQTSNSYGSATQWDDADRFVASGLKTIASSQSTTSAEKTIAKLGFDMGNHAGMNYDNSARAGFAAIKTIASSVGGPLGAVLAKTVGSAYGGADEWDDADRIVQTGLNTISQSPDVEQIDRDVANLGFAMGNFGGMEWDNSARARFAAIDVLQTSPTGETGDILASVALKAYGRADQWDDADNITGAGLKAIINNPKSSDLDKALAKATWEQTNQDGIQFESSARTRAAALRSII